MPRKGRLMFVFVLDNYIYLVFWVKKKDLNSCFNITYTYC